MNIIDLQTLVTLFGTYGYIAVFGILLLCGFGLPIPEDISLVAGGIIAGLGYCDPHLMFVVCLAGVLLGDLTMFSLGRIFKERILKFRLLSRILTPARYAEVQRRFAHHSRWVLFFARFTPGLRAPIYVVAGITGKVSYFRFIFTDTLAALISVPIWVYLGYFGANRNEWLIRSIHRGQIGIFSVLGTLACAASIYYFVTRAKKRFQKRATQKGETLSNNEIKERADKPERMERTDRSPAARTLPVDAPAQD